jgi:hypothetical protein
LRNFIRKAEKNDSPLPIHFLGWNGIESTITVATAALLYQPRMMMDVEQSVECLLEETEVLGENLP